MSLVKWFATLEKIFRETKKIRSAPGVAVLKKVRKNPKWVEQFSLEKKNHGIHVELLTSLLGRNIA